MPFRAGPRVSLGQKPEMNETFARRCAMRGWGFVTVLDPDAAMGEWHAHAARARGSDACSPSKRWPMDAPLVSYVFNGGGPLMSDAQSVPFAVVNSVTTITLNRPIGGTR